MPVCFETWQTVVQSTPMAEFSFGFTEGSFMQLNGHKRLRSVAEDLISNKQKRTRRIYQKRRRHGHDKTLKSIFLNRSCENKYHEMKTSSVWLLNIN